MIVWCSASRCEFGLVARRCLDVAARSVRLDRGRQRLTGSVQVGRVGSGAGTMSSGGLDSLQVDGARFGVLIAAAVAVDLVDDVRQTGAAVAGQEDWNDDEQRQVHRGVLLVTQRLSCRETSLCHFCTTSTPFHRTTAARASRSLGRFRIKSWILAIFKIWFSRRDKRDEVLIRGDSKMPIQRESRS